MADRQPPDWEEIRGLIQRVDEVCRESELIRDRAEEAMRHRPFWPDRRRRPRIDAPTVPPSGNDDTER